MKGIGIFLLAFILLLTVLSPTAASALSLPEEEWEGFEAAVPDDIRDRLTADMEDAESFGKDVAEMSKGQYIASVIGEMLGVELRSGMLLMLSLLAVIGISAVFGAFAQGEGGGGLGTAVRFCSSAALISTVLYTLYSHFGAVDTLFGKLCGLMDGMIPVTAALWAMGGNVGTASVGGASFYVILNVSRILLAGTLIPVCSLLAVLGFCDALSEEVRTGRIMNAVKKLYNFLIGGVMTVLLASLGAQTVIAASADTVTAKTAKLLSGTLIPVVGGSVGETLRTLGGGVSYLKSIFGVGGILLILLTVMPVLLSVLCTRFVFMVSGGVADMLGCGPEARLLENLSEVWGTMLAVISGVSVTFVLGLCIFMQTVVAVM